MPDLLWVSSSAETCKGRVDKKTLINAKTLGKRIARPSSTQDEALIAQMCCEVSPAIVSRLRDGGSSAVVSTPS